MRRVAPLIAVSSAIFILLAGAVTVLAIQDRTEDAVPAIRTDDVASELYQSSVSIYEEKREVVDFINAPGRLIQQGLLKNGVVIYDQN